MKTITDMWGRNFEYKLCPKHMSRHRKDLWEPGLKQQLESEKNWDEISHYRVMCICITLQFSFWVQSSSLSTTVKI